MRARFWIAIVHTSVVAGCSSLLAEHTALHPESESPAALSARHASAEPFEQLAALAWSQRPRSAWNDSAEAFRWDPAPLDPQAGAAKIAPARLVAALQSGDPIVSRNAALLLARQGDPQGYAILEDLVRDRAPSVPLASRAAAAEALGYARTSNPAGKLRALDRELDAGETIVRSELLRGLARHVSPAREPLLIAALESPEGIVRRAAVDAWRPAKHGPLPPSVLRLVNDHDPRVRIAVIELIAIRRDVASLKIVEAAWVDRDRTVREYAAAALARLGTDEAAALLEQRAVEGAELDRAVAVRALALSRESKAVYEAVEDPSWRVRRAAVTALAGYPDAKTAAAVGPLITDPSLEVQTATVDALSDWPDPLAVPLLLDALENGAFRTRTKALSQLEGRWKTDLKGPVTASAAEWGELAARLRNTWKVDGGLLAAQQLPLPAPTTSPLESPLGRQVLKMLETLQGSDPDAARRAGEQLVALGPSALPAIHRWAEGRPRPLPEPLVAQVLPRLSPLYAAVGRLTADKVHERQKTVGELKQLVDDQTLPRPAAEDLAAHLAFEDDPFVWQEILKTLELDHATLARRAARVGLGHPRSAVRRQSCELLARHPRTDQVGWLEPLLRDEHPAVRLAAADALGASGNPAAAPALSRLLTSPSKSLRITTATALARLGEEQGRDELVRLAYDLDSEVRREAALAMGKVGHEAFLPVLIAKLDDRQSDVRRAALASLEILAGTKAETQAIPKIVDPKQQIDVWKRWWATRNTGLAGAKRSAPR